MGEVIIFPKRIKALQVNHTTGTITIQEIRDISERVALDKLLRLAEQKRIGDQRGKD